MRFVVRVVAGAGVLALSPLAGLAALAGMAMAGARPAVFAVTGLAVFGSVFFLGLLLCVPRPEAPWGRWSRAVLVLAVEGAVVWWVSGATLTPPPAPVAAAPVAGQREWRLPTGSRLAYVRIAPKRVTRAEPVVFLHGGPGVADLAADSAFYGRLSADGYEVYVYDQLGAGRSARLPDPGAYGLARDVADLEAVRQAIGARRMNLVARDHGARLAAAYLAGHPDRVSRAALVSPAALDHPQTQTLLDGRPPDPRTLAVYTLLRVEPRAAHTFAGDGEIDGKVDARPGRDHATCAAATATGGYASLVRRPPPPGLREALARVNVPVLVVKGTCDGQPWSAATDYRRALPGARFAYVKDGGTAYLATLRTFLADRPLPAYEAATPPPGYRGPW
ncbi:MAG: alpha/beta fold hydrolase [Nonomuraea sp.]|nr:alpha/beta fold hydrolase [Nonomuraea sp.]NUP45507.1 alpha/beta fold hydrolase [Streptomyces sp.]NUP80080.1 alpha/beta fold hydrolase [Nonomuraea sp.]NUR91214.1 alpha/beta fold hydrolase [Nonomuraea sp.]